LAGIYIHIPFCRQACHYCNFHFATSLHYKNELIAALVKEIDLIPFPSPSRQLAGEKGETAPEYDVLIYVANWPEKRIHAWKTLLQARAIENQCYVAGVNRVGDDGNNIHYSGESMIVDPLGEVLYIKKEEEDIFTITLDKTHLQTVREKVPFLKDADGFQIITNSE
jgi:predicted amidohydrolase